MKRLYRLHGLKYMVQSILNQKKILLLLVSIGLSLLGAHYFISGSEKELIVIIPSYNNSQWCEQNLSSIFNQKYAHYRIIYIDDCSTDETYEKVAAYIQKAGQSHRVKLIHNEQRRGALANLYYAIHSCPDSAIIVTVDGDDALKHDNVFAVINNAYKDSSVWMTFGQYEVSPGGYLGICHAIPQPIIQHNAYREYDWVTSHLRTFRAGLFKHVHKDDLWYQDNFFDVAWDQAFLFPMLEMAAGHWKFIPDILYVYNEGNPLNDFKMHSQRQSYCSYIIRHKNKYQPIDDKLAATWYS